jgi:hypothetical protein
MIQERMQSGAFLSVEDVLMDALKARTREPKVPIGLEKLSLAQLFAESPLKGMSLDFERFPDTWPPTTP